MIQIRACTIADLIVLQEMSIETYYDTFAPYNSEKNMTAYLTSAYNERQLAKELNDPNVRFFFVGVEGIPAGYMKVNVGTSQTESLGDDSMEVERLYIRPSYKRQGLGSELLHFAVDLACQERKRAVWLGVWERNEAAQAFYASEGFVRTGEHSFFMGDDEQTDYILTKELV